MFRGRETGVWVWDFPLTICGSWAICLTCLSLIWLICKRVLIYKYLSSFLPIWGMGEDADLNRFLWLSGFCLGSVSEGPSRRLKDIMQESLKYLFPLECCSSVIICDIPWPQLLQGSSPSRLQLLLLPPLASSGLEVKMASHCCFAWVPQHLSLVSLTPPMPMKRIPSVNYPNISLKYDSRKSVVTSWGPKGYIHQWLPVGLRIEPKLFFTRPPQPC